MTQSQVIESRPGQTEIGYPTGITGFAWQQWLGRYVGVGLDGRVLDWTSRGTVTESRAQRLGNLELVARYPGHWLEPDVSVGAAVRNEDFGGSAQVGYGALLGAGLRIQPLSAIALRLWGRDYPGGIGGDGLWSAGAQILIDAGVGLATVGYTWDQVAIGTGGKATYGTVVLGLGLQY
ncbi:MAG: hypothetical protein KGR26_00485 [Cyanobacteria bacterium REEB65]|nr:hypothetical protein [Cyanobacteria bacterium REEB65]